MTHLQFSEIQKLIDYSVTLMLVSDLVTVLSLGIMAGMIIYIWRASK